MTAAEIFNSVTNGGADDFAEIVRILEAAGLPWCLLDSSPHVPEPTYAACIEVIVAAPAVNYLSALGWLRPGETTAERALLKSKRNKLSVELVFGPRYQDFPNRAVPANVLGVPVKVAAIEDLIRSKVWAYNDPERRPAKRFKDAADIANLVEAFP
jgi:hypothetical protein